MSKTACNKQRIACGAEVSAITAAKLLESAQLEPMETSKNGP